MVSRDDIFWVNKQYAALAQKHGLNPALLKDIIILNNRGFSQTRIASMLNISRQTVSSYLKTMGEMPQTDLTKLLINIGLIVGGIYVLKELFKEATDDDQSAQGHSDDTNKSFF